MHENRPIIAPYISTACFLLINGLFIVKYMLREGGSIGLFMIAALLYLAFSFLIVWKSDAIVSRRMLTWIVILYSIAGAVIVHNIPIDQFMADRWKIITVFSQAMENGDYPYDAMSSCGNKPGASPVYFLIGYPFYKINFFQGMPLLVPWLWMLCVPDISAKKRVVTTLLLITSPVMCYEIITRSTIIFNAVLVFLWAVYFLRFRRWNTKTLILNAVLAGLLLNTRSAFVLVFIISWFSYARIYPKLLSRLLLWGVIGAMSFIMVFVIMAIIWGMDNVIGANPFTVQTDNLYPIWFTVLLMVSSVVIGLCNKRCPGIIFLCGMTMFFAAVGYMVLCFDIYGIYASIFDSMSDITYMLLCYPFLLYGIGYCKIKRTSESRVTHGGPL